MPLNLPPEGVPPVGKLTSTSLIVGDPKTGFGALDNSGLGLRLAELSTSSLSKIGIVIYFFLSTSSTVRGPIWFNISSTPAALTCPC